MGAAAAGVITLTACGADSDGESGKGGPLTMTVWGGDSDRVAYQKRLDLLVAKYPDLSVKLQLIPDETYAQKVQTMIAGGTGPDIMEVAENVNAYAGKNQLLPLDELVKKAGLDLAAGYGAVGGIYTYKNQVFAIPDRSGAMIVYYNKALFTKAGLKLPSAESTWEEMLASFQALSIPGKQWGFAGAGWWPQWWSLAYQNGGKIIDDAGRPAVNSPEVVEALAWVGDLTTRHKVVPTKEQYADMGADVGGDQAFANGKVAVNITGFWAISGLLKSEIDWDIAPMWRGKQQAVSAFGSGLAISRTAKNPDNAFKAIQFLTSPEAQKTIIDLGQDVPASVEVQKSDAFLKPAWMTKSVNMKAFGDSSAFVYRAPFIPEWNEMQKAFDDGLANFFLGKQDAKSALDAIQKQLESIIKPA
ncbi:sugar ABC transporter substrate-binding protein [Paractinoplanes rishiriensis]|uniref:Sugar ABC transporter substrate-binding protein n=2 Tax=Paractinoplanes rishiriensis TaxID=1050105 RepID=A0A919JV71_9ACTN|nr:sugar ABC transporter substrate-binding protein [Actinoplanes rishiriensis]